MSDNYRIDKVFCIYIHTGVLYAPSGFSIKSAFFGDYMSPKIPDYGLINPGILSKSRFE
jgi:hypothetical protein